METKEQEMGPVQATGYIAGVGVGVGQAVLGGHFRVLAIATVCAVLLMFYFETTPDLIRLLITYVATVALVLGHALLRRPGE